jgi:hypothetical protein
MKTCKSLTHTHTHTHNVTTGNEAVKEVQYIITGAVFGPVLGS